ncbi:hypothetical protein QVD17_28276 [Tagetes erecta]|uniref:Uncharacterized protein n=1 Tax=Tagetes erecta TaxID=13708 RepID=A0AAD8NSB6_TARER|nr:hypothetical protein QVD17_28276 [Tagetes erecta]
MHHCLSVVSFHKLRFGSLSSLRLVHVHFWAHMEPCKKVNDKVLRGESNPDSPVDRFNGFRSGFDPFIYCQNILKQKLSGRVVSSSATLLPKFNTTSRSSFYSSRLLGNHPENHCNLHTWWRAGRLPPLTASGIKNRSYANTKLLAVKAAVA